MDSLGGSGMAIMVACVSPAHVYAEETLSTLYYASRARNIQNKPVKKVNAKDRIIAQLIQEVQRLKTENLQMKTYILRLPQSQQGQGQAQQGQTPQSQQGQGQIQQNVMPMQQQTQPRAFPARNAPLTQSQDRPFSWEQQNRSRSVMSVPTSASSNVQRFPSGQLMQRSMQQGQGQGQGQGQMYQQREQAQSMKVMKPG